MFIDLSCGSPIKNQVATGHMTPPFPRPSTHTYATLHQYLRGFRQCCREIGFEELWWGGTQGNTLGTLANL